MKNAFRAFGISSLILGGTTAGFSLGVLIGYIKDTTIHDARENKTDR